MYESDIVLGNQYTDSQTGFSGIATSNTFFQYACERVALETYDAERMMVRTEIFDAPRLTDNLTGKKAETEKTGGPQMPAAQFNPRR